MHLKTLQLVYIQILTLLLYLMSYLIRF